MKKTNPFLVSIAIFFSLLVFISNTNLSSAQAPLPTAPAPTTIAEPDKATVDSSSSSKYAVLAPLPCIEGNGIVCDGGNGALQNEVDFKTYVQYTINLLIALSAVTAVVMIVWGGIEYMWSNSFSDKKMGLERAQNAIYGLLLVLSSYIILRTIDPRLVEIPNTLVPQLTIEEWLKKDANFEMMSRLEKDIDEYYQKRTELGIELKEQQKIKNSKILEVNRLKKEIEEQIKKNPDPSDPEFLSLMTKLRIAEAESITEQGKYQIDKAKGDFNAILSDTTYDQLGDATDNSVHANSIKTINEKKVLLGEINNRATKALSDIKYYDYSAVTDQYMYTKNTMDIMIVNIILDQYGSDEGVIMKLDGTLPVFATNKSRTEAAAALEKDLDNELKRIATENSEIRDENKALKEATAKKLEEVQKRFESVFGK